MDQIHDQLRAAPYKDTVLRELYALVQARDADLEAVAAASFKAIGSLSTFQQTQEFLQAEDVVVRMPARSPCSSSENTAACKRLPTAARA